MSPYLCLTWNDNRQTPNFDLDNKLGVPTASDGRMPTLIVTGRTETSLIVLFISGSYMKSPQFDEHDIWCRCWPYGESEPRYFILDVINAIPTVWPGVGNVMLKYIFSHAAAPMERYVRNLTNLGRAIIISVGQKAYLKIDALKSTPAFWTVYHAQTRNVFIKF